MDYQILADEISNDPGARGYAGMTDAEVAAALNTADITRIRTSMTGREVFEATDSAEYAALTDSKKQEWIGFCGIAEHDPKAGGPAQAFVTYIYGGGSTTVSNLSSLREETISRATELGLGVIEDWQVTKARAI